MATKTIRDVARLAGVSVASASRAMNGHSNVAADTRDRVLNAARELRYVPHSGARSLTRRRNDAIGVVLPDLFDEFFSELVRGIDCVAHRAGKQLLLANMHGSPHETVNAIRAMRGRVDGLLVMPPDIDMEFLRDCLPTDMPAVAINFDATPLGISSVTIDNYSGAYRMTALLVESGYKRIVHIAGPRHNRDAQERQRGFCDAMRDLLGEHGAIVLPGDFTEAGGADAARLLLAGRVPYDAVFAGNDMMAVGCLSVFDDAAISVPGTVAVAGFDDIPLARFVSPALTTAQVHIAKLGSVAMEILLAQLADGVATDPQQHVLTPELVVRNSTTINRTIFSETPAETGIT